MTSNLLCYIRIESRPFGEGEDRNACVRYPFPISRWNLFSFPATGAHGAPRLNGRPHGMAPRWPLRGGTLRDVRLYLVLRGLPLLFRAVPDGLLVLRRGRQLWREAPGIPPDPFPADFFEASTRG